jgi:hypothetical protein
MCILAHVSHTCISSQTFCGCEMLVLEGERINAIATISEDMSSPNRSINVRMARKLLADFGKRSCRRAMSDLIIMSTTLRLQRRMRGGLLKDWILDGIICRPCLLVGI